MSLYVVCIGDLCLTSSSLLSNITTNQRQRKIKKLYLAVTTEPVPLGMHVHWMWASLNARGQQGGTPCQFVSHAPPESRKKAKVSCRDCLLSDFFYTCERSMCLESFTHMSLVTLTFF